VEDKEKEEITGQLTRRSLPTMSSRLVTKVWISQEKEKEEESARKSPEEWLPIMSSRLVEEKEEVAKEKAEVTW
jgi:hypothetical protein